MKVETKYSKLFAKKLIALFLSVLMAMSCFTGALTAFAASVQTDKDYHDGNLASNFMAWAETSDEQTCEALLDWADMHLADIMTSLLGSTHLDIKYKALGIGIELHGKLDSVDGLFDLLNQVDSQLTSTLKNLAGGDVKNINLDPTGSDLKPINDASQTISETGIAYRAVYSAKDLILALARLIEVNSNDIDGKNVIGQFVKGTLNLGGILEGILKDDIYGLLQSTLGMWDQYQINLVYNIVANALLENTKWFDAQTLSEYRSDIRATSLANRTYKFNFDKVLMKALSENLLDEIHVEVTYPNYVRNENGNMVNDSSVKRYKRICAALGKEITDATIDQTSTAFVNAAKADAASHNYTYDSSVIYFSNNTKNEAATADMSLDTGCVFLFQKRNADNSISKLQFAYTEDSNGITLTNENLYSFAFKALEYAWDVALKPTLGLVHVNYDVERGHGTNFDNAFFYWMVDNKGWDTSDWQSNYEYDNVLEWAEAVYGEYNNYERDEDGNILVDEDENPIVRYLRDENGDIIYDENNVAQHEDVNFANANAFLDYVRNNYDHNRSVDVKGEEASWRDINPNTLFNRLRYSPLADLTFDMQTGPINLYFEQTGIEPVSTFFETAFDNYANMVAGLNDALVSVTELIFPDSSNIGCGSTGSENYRKPEIALSVPQMNKTRSEGATGVTNVNINQIVTTLIDNVVRMFEYAANAADANILNPYYEANNISTKANNVSEGVFEDAMLPLLIACLQKIEMTEPIHDEKWDACADAEGVAIVALEEYLSYVLPDKDYSVLWATDADGTIVAKGSNGLFEEAVMPMCRDALGYIISSVVPCRKTDGSEWNVYTSPVNDSTTIFDILNSVVCYYVSQDDFSDGTSGKAVATLLGAVNSSNEPVVSMSNSLWKNLDGIINKLLPAIGTAQYGDVSGYGHANTKQLLYYDLIEGILDIGSETYVCDENGAVTGTSGRMGVSNLVYRLLTIITSSPVSANVATPNESTDGSSTLIQMVYNLLADVVNNVFGNRLGYTAYSKVIPYADYYDRDSDSKGTSSATPFDSLVATSTLGYFSGDSGDGKETGVLCILIYNIFKAFGGNNTTTGNTKTTGTKGCWIGAMFAVEAVNNFIPSFVPQLSDHEFGVASAEVANPGQSGLTANNPITETTLDITNNTRGLNRFYRDSNGNVQRDPRYFIYIKSIDQANDTSASNLTIASYDRVIAPDKTLKVGISGSAPANPTTYTFTITYDIFEGEMSGTSKPTYSADKVVQGCSNIKATAYMYLTTEVDWATKLYNENGEYNTEFVISGTGLDGKTTAYTHCAPRYGGSNITWGGPTLMPVYPNDFIIPMSDPSSINGLKFEVLNGGGLNSDGKSFDGLYACVMVGQTYYKVTGTTMDSIETTLTTAPESTERDGYEKGKHISDKHKAYAAIDPETGDILNYGRWDYSTNSGETWHRGPVLWDHFACGYSQTELDSAITDPSNSLYDADVAEAKATGTFTTRYHVAWTIEEAVTDGVVEGVQRTVSKYDDAGNPSEYIYSGVILKTDAASMTKSVTVNDSTESVITKLLKNDNPEISGNDASSPYESISWGTPTPGVYFGCGKASTSKGGIKWMPFLKYDGETELSQDDYNMGVFLYTTDNQNMVGEINVHVADDSDKNSLKDVYNDALATYSTYSVEDTAEGKEYTYTDLAEALKSSVATIATPINRDNASTLGSTMETVPATNDSTDQYGDKAYKPLTADTTIPSSLLLKAYKGTGVYSGDTQYWFYNEECTIPICGGWNQPLTDDDVYTYMENGTRKYKEKVSGLEVAKVDNVWRYVNAPKYTREWVLPGEEGSYETPYQKLSSTQAVDSMNKPLYNRISFTCYDESGKSMDSRGNFTYTIADKKLTIKENDTNDYRGIFERQKDNLAYYLEQLKANVNTEIAYTIYNGVMDDRKNQNSVNYDVASYEKMVQIAKSAEKLIWSIPDGEPRYYAVNKDGEKVLVVLSDQSTSINTLYEDAEGNLYKNEKVEKVQDYTWTTDKSNVQIVAGLNLYNKFKARAKSRGYIGNKLVDEINCATNYDYTALDFTKQTRTVTPEDGDPYEVIDSATITSSSATNAKYGSWVDGELVNINAETGKQAYTDASWNAYVIALANGIEIADEQTKAVSGTYTAKTDIQKAENNLEIFVGEDDSTITISGTVLISVVPDSSTTSKGIDGIEVVVGATQNDRGQWVGGEVIDVTHDLGQFTAVVPADTTQLVFRGSTTIDRAVSLSGSSASNVEVPIVICDYNHDSYINNADTGLFFVALGVYNTNMDLNVDNFCNNADYGVYLKFLGQAITYPDLVLGE